MAYGEGFRRGGFRRGGFRRFPREMTKITCSECGKEAEVPFKPREGTPVYCRECYFKKKGITPREPRQPERTEEKAEGKVESEEVEGTEKDGIEESDEGAEEIVEEAE